MTNPISCVREWLNKLIRNSSSSDYLDTLEKIARNCSDLKLYKHAVMFNYCLLKQKTTEDRRKRIMIDFKFTNLMWEFSHDGNFIQCISNGSVKGIVNDDNVNVRKDPYLVSKVIRMLNLSDEVKVLQRSNFKQYIEKEKTNAYWYKIRTDDGTEGWVYGKFLTFYPIP